MTQLSKNYARALYELGISGEAIDTARKLCQVKELTDALSSPIVAKKAKHNIVDRVFPKEMHNFMKLLSDYGSTKYINEIFMAYDEYVNEQNDCMEAQLICVEAPNKEQKIKIEQFLMGEYGKSKIKLNISIDEKLIGGFVLKAYDREYDWSMKGRISRLAGHLKNI